jgi:hypothetical protein
VVSSFFGAFHVVFVSYGKKEGAPERFAGFGCGFVVLGWATPKNYGHSPIWLNREDIYLSSNPCGIFLSFIHLDTSLIVGERRRERLEEDTSCVSALSSTSACFETLSSFSTY